MKKLLIGILIFIAIAILSFIVWWNLPVEIHYKSDIKYGNTLIENIERYQQETNTLPSNGDWEILKQLGFIFNDMGTTIPDYETDGNEFELVFIEGFGAPYLLWNSSERKWKMDFPIYYKFTEIED